MEKWYNFRSIEVGSTENRSFPQKEARSFLPFPPCWSEVFGLGVYFPQIICFHHQLWILHSFQNPDCGSKLGYILRIFARGKYVKTKGKNKHLKEIGLFSMCSFGVLTSDMMNGDGTIFCFKMIESFGMISQQTSWLTPNWTWTSGVKKYLLAMIYWTNAFSSKVNLVSNLFPMSVLLKCWPTPSREHS